MTLDYLRFSPGLGSAAAEKQARAQEFPSSAGCPTWEVKAGLTEPRSAPPGIPGLSLASGEQSTAPLIADLGEEEGRLACPPAPRGRGADPGTLRCSRARALGHTQTPIDPVDPYGPLMPSARPLYPPQAPIAPTQAPIAPSDYQLGSSSPHPGPYSPHPGPYSPLMPSGRPLVAQAYVNQRKLDHEVKTLQVQAAQFAKQTGQWITMVENFNQALKEIGDVENWARSIEMDMRTIATALEYVYKGQLQPSCS
ncbi:PREDICTED: biogenesis of lysosome-related organelles complex 1 subunit 1 [Nipponia nippon]|nr:PREDICTED: biogenesis of lysosome-related organelles complex 1 subunit 1 [Nipponia nippon]